MQRVSPAASGFFEDGGDFDPDRDEGRLALTSEDGTANLVEASRFADLLRQAKPIPRLVVLNSCQGGVASTSDPFAGTAASLARSGVAAVTAMQYSVSDYEATAFARGFYSALAHAHLDRAVNDLTYRLTEGLSSAWEPVPDAAPQPALPADGPVESLRQQLSRRADVCRVMPFRPCYPRVRRLPEPDLCCS